MIMVFLSNFRLPLFLDKRGGQASSSHRHLHDRPYSRSFLTLWPVTVGLFCCYIDLFCLTLPLTSSRCHASTHRARTRQQPRFAINETSLSIDLAHPRGMPEVRPRHTPMTLTLTHAHTHLSACTVKMCELRIAFTNV